MKMQHFNFCNKLFFLQNGSVNFDNSIGADKRTISAAGAVIIYRHQIPVSFIVNILGKVKSVLFANNGAELTSFAFLDINFNLSFYLRAFFSFAFIISAMIFFL
jgi:hypothetical protein